MCSYGDWRYAVDVLSAAAPVQQAVAAGVVFLSPSMVEEMGG